MRGTSGASTVRFGKNFLKQKLQGAPDLVGAGYLFGPQIRKDLGPYSQNLNLGKKVKQKLSIS